MQNGTVEIESEGKVYTGEYEVDADGVLWLRSDISPLPKKTQLGGMPPDELAKLLLWELVREVTSNAKRVP